MHPIRLAMIKILYDNYKLTTIELKQILQLDKNSFHNNLNSLEKDRLIEITKELTENGITNIVELKHDTQIKYEEFTRAIIEFLDETNYY
jgi:DNA-binding MarR family transcriptional regulator